MFADPSLFVIDYPSDTQQTTSFALNNIAGSTSVRKYYNATPGLSKRIDISHTPVGSGNSARVRHLFKVTSRQVVDGVESLSAPPIMLYAVADIPVAAQIALPTGLLDVWRQFTGTMRGKGGLVNYGDPALFFYKWIDGQS